MGQVPQLLSRLFPFTRGLNHAFWAPNVWALVTAADRVLLRCMYTTFPSAEHTITQFLFTDIKHMGAEIVINAPGVVSTSRGLVGDTIFAVLPNIKPIHTFVITILFQSVSDQWILLNTGSPQVQQLFLIKLWFSPTYKSFLTALTLCGYTSFLFGWHVHEKAVLLVLVPMR